MKKSMSAKRLSGTRVLVTGATGFIGRHLCRALVAEKAQVYGLRRPDASRHTIPELPASVEWLEADLCDFERLEAVLRDTAPACIFHLAAATTVNRGFETARTMITDNVLGTVNLLHALEEVPYTCFIHTGSAEEYGLATAPFREDAFPMPVSAYSASKASAALFCDMFHRTLQRPITILRPFLVYGPEQKPDKLIPQAIQAALNNRRFPMTSGRQKREFTYVDDLIAGYLKAAVTPEAVGQTINLGTGEPWTILEVVEKIRQLTGSSMQIDTGVLPDRAGEIMNFQCDNTKARRLLGWTPQTSLTQGLQKTIDWYAAHSRP